MIMVLVFWWWQPSRGGAGDNGGGGLSGGGGLVRIRWWWWMCWWCFNVGGVLVALLTLVLSCPKISKKSKRNHYNLQAVGRAQRKGQRREEESWCAALSGTLQTGRWWKQGLWRTENPANQHHTCSSWLRTAGTPNIDIKSNITFIGAMWFLAVVQDQAEEQFKPRSKTRIGTSATLTAY